MQILLTNASDCLYSLALFRFQIKEQPQHPPSSSLLFPSWQKLKAYIFPRMLVSLPRTCHDIIFNSVFSSLLFFMEEPLFSFICTPICFALSFPSSLLLIKHLGLIPAKCQMYCAGSWAEIPLLIKSPFLNSLSCSCQPWCQTVSCLPKSPQQHQMSGSQPLLLLACAEKRQLKPDRYGDIS